MGHYKVTIWGQPRSCMIASHRTHFKFFLRGSENLEILSSGTHALFPRAWRTPDSNLSCATNGQHEPRRCPLNICAWYQQLQNEEWTAEFLFFNSCSLSFGETHPAFALAQSLRRSDQCLGTHPSPPLSVGTGPRAHLGWFLLSWSGERSFFFFF